MRQADIAATKAPKAIASLAKAAALPRRARSVKTVDQALLEEGSECALASGGCAALSSLRKAGRARKIKKEEKKKSSELIYDRRVPREVSCVAYI